MIYKRILVGLDGSKRADNAFDVACALAKTLSAKLFIVWIVNHDQGMDSAFGVNNDFYQDLAEQLKQKISPYVDRATKDGIQASGDVLIGSIKTILAREYPDQHDIDLIVLGNTGINAVEKMLQGSHTDYVVRHSSADVLVVK